jgi:hypothetical protein
VIQDKAAERSTKTRVQLSNIDAGAGGISLTANDCGGLVGLLSGWLVGLLSDWLAGLLLAWLVGLLLGWLAGLLSDWLVRLLSA